MRSLDTFKTKSFMTVFTFNIDDLSFVSYYIACDASLYVERSSLNFFPSRFFFPLLSVSFLCAQLTSASLVTEGAVVHIINDFLELLNGDVFVGVLGPKTFIANAIFTPLAELG